MLKSFALLILFTIFSPLAAAKAYVATAGAQKVPPTSLSPEIGITRNCAELGSKAGFLIADPGFVPMINNSVYIEPEVFLSSCNYLLLGVHMQWQFHLSPQWSVFAAPGAEMPVFFGKNTDKRDFSVFGGSTLGAIYWMDPNFGVRFESFGTLLSNGGIRIGVFMGI